MLCICLILCRLTKEVKRDRVWGVDYAIKHKEKQLCFLEVLFHSYVRTRIVLSMQCCIKQYKIILEVPTQSCLETCNGTKKWVILITFSPMTETRDSLKFRGSTTEYIMLRNQNFIIF